MRPEPGKLGFRVVGAGSTLPEMSRHVAAVLAAGFVVTGCGDQPRESVPDAFVGPADARLPDAGLPPFMGHIYAHSLSTLYKVDPDTLEVTPIGPFGWPPGYESELMTDIAVSYDNEITGVSFGAVFAVDRDTAAVTFLANLTGQQFNGLTFIPQSGGTEILVGTGLGGTLWQIDPTTGDSTQIGAFGGLMTSSGDIVSVAGFGTVATVKNGSEIDYLARIDEATGAATIIGTTGEYDIWGIGYWRNRVFGFMSTNEFVLIDVLTGDATFVSLGPENWAGAGVTTRAPIEP